MKIKAKSIPEKFQTTMQIMKGTIISIIITMLLILVFALCIRFFTISNKAIKPVNMTIKAISIAIGVLFATKDGKQGIKKGTILGLAYTILAFLVFSIISKTMTMGWKLILDLLFGAGVGILTGVVYVNLRK